MTAQIRPFKIDVEFDTIADLRERLRQTRWPEGETVEDWSQGVPLSYQQEFCDYWGSRYDWYQTQSRLNQFDQFVSEFDGLDIHFIHVRSPIKNARPLIMTHGWPGSVVEFHKVIAPLTNPLEHGGRAEDAFHVVCPSLPGYGFSAKPKTPGWGVTKIAQVWDQLMSRLSYQAYYAQGGDWGSAVTTAIGIANEGRCQGIHVNMPNSTATEAARTNPNAADKLALAAAIAHQASGTGYSKQQSTRPQTLGYGLADSPSGQAAWILEKFYAWTDCGGHPENVLTRDELIDNIMLYWLSNSATSSARLYWESFAKAFAPDADNSVHIPTGCSIFPKEIVAMPRSWAQRRYKNIRYWNELDRGGHFAAFEQPQLFVNELRQCFASFRRLD